MIAACPKCQTRYRLRMEQIGERGVRLRCRRCEALFRVLPPGDSDAAPRPAAAAPEMPERAPEPQAPPRPERSGAPPVPTLTQDPPAVGSVGESVPTGAPGRVT